MNLQDALAAAQEAAHRAGAAVLSYYTSRYAVHHKSGGNPVTTADLEANAVLREALLGAFPESGWLSEESPDDGERLGKEWVWIVDPLDGTREFIQGIDEFALSVALVHGAAPVLAVTYNPAAGRMTHCIRGSGAFLNGRPVRVTDRSQLRGAPRWPAGARPGGDSLTGSGRSCPSSPRGASPTSSRRWPAAAPT